MSAATTTRLAALGLSSNCIEVLQHLWEYLDDELSPASAARFRAHIAGCAQCREYESYQSCFLEAAAKLKAQFDAPDTLRQKLASKLRGEGCGCWARAKREE